MTAPKIPGCTCPENWETCPVSCGYGTEITGSLLTRADADEFRRYDEELRKQEEESA